MVSILTCSFIFWQRKSFNDLITKRQCATGSWNGEAGIWSKSENTVPQFRCTNPLSSRQEFNNRQDPSQARHITENTGKTKYEEKANRTKYRDKTGKVRSEHKD